DSQHLEVSEQQHLSGSDAGGQQYDADYVLELAFGNVVGIVLLPACIAAAKLLLFSKSQNNNIVAAAMQAGSSTMPTTFPNASSCSCRSSAASASCLELAATKNQSTYTNRRQSHRLRSSHELPKRSQKLQSRTMGSMPMPFRLMLR